MPNKKRVILSSKSIY